MEGIIQYRLLGNHPAASGRYLTVGFPGETTTTDKILDQVIQEHRINTSRYKLEVCRLAAGRDAPALAPVSVPHPPENSSGTFSGLGTTAGGQNTLVPVVIYGPEVLHTYDRLTITVSKRDLADDEASQREKERLERQRQLKEMEEQLLSTTSGLGSFADGGSGAHTAASPSPQPARSVAGARPSSSSAAPAKDNLHLQRAVALASQLFPIMKGQRSTLTGIHDAANTHECVLCRLPAFEELLTPCCWFCVCRSCYASASEMVMKEEQCPVCGIIVSPASSAVSAFEPALHSGSLTKAGKDSKASAKRGRDTEPDDRSGRKREEGEYKVPLQRVVSVRGAEASKSRNSHGDGRTATYALASSIDAAAAARLSMASFGSGCATVSNVAGSRTGCGGDASNAAATVTFSKEVLRTEERLRSDLDQALSMLDAPDPLSAVAKAKRIIGPELAALSE
ncbi:hypothetical protein LSCM1_02732 [Leishmania martiniquensis]|uniref:RING-type domain-containing protein n=1 Tax=Leishmania martiniquensis TaxID=1580590 RepID=A0A836GCB8_9TRYP|nr:hypothetical protein LSCM1_02732 [Leishmania martiniquensis]